MFNTCSSSTASPLGFPSGVFVGPLVVGGGAHGVGGVACKMLVLIPRKLILALRILILAFRPLILAPRPLILAFRILIRTLVILGLVPHAQRVLPNPHLLLIPRFFKLLKICMIRNR